MLPSLAREFALLSPLSFVRTKKVQGQRVFGVRGKATADQPYLATLFARTADALPVEERITAGSVAQTTVLSRWNAPIHIALPGHTTAVSVVVKSQ